MLLKEQMNPIFERNFYFASQTKLLLGSEVLYGQNNDYTQKRKY